MGSQRVGDDWGTNTSTSTSMGFVDPIPEVCQRLKGRGSKKGHLFLKAVCMKSQEGGLPIRKSYCYRSQKGGKWLSDLRKYIILGGSIPRMIYNHKECVSWSPGPEQSIQTHSCPVHSRYWEIPDGATSILLLAVILLATCLFGKNWILYHL